MRKRIMESKQRRNSAPCVFVITATLSYFMLVCQSEATTTTSATNQVGFQQNSLPSSAVKASTSEEPFEIVLQWYEDKEEATRAASDVREESSLKKPRRKILWLGRMDDECSYHPNYRHSARRRKQLLELQSSPPTPHDLRMEQWNFTISWREHKRQRNSNMVFEFHENGSVRCLHSPDHDSKKFGWPFLVKGLSRHVISKEEEEEEVLNNNDDSSSPPPTYIEGTWKLAPCGVVWKLTWDDDTRYTFYADLHLNPFGKHPKMFKGMVIRDRNNKFAPANFLRPLAATFHGVGVGQDTADFSYKNRKFGTTTTTSKSPPTEKQ